MIGPKGHAGNAGDAGVQGVPGEQGTPVRFALTYLIHSKWSNSVFEKPKKYWNKKENVQLKCYRRSNQCISSLDLYDSWTTLLLNKEIL